MTNRIRAKRLEKGWSQAEFAEKLGVSRQTANALESGKTDPGLSLAMRAAWLLGCTLDELFVADLEEQMLVLNAAWQYQDRFVTAFDEVQVYREMGIAGWELIGFGVMSRFRRPEDPALRRAWEYYRVEGLLNATDRAAMEKDWTFIGSWMALFHYFKREIAPPKELSPEEAS